MLKKFTYNFLTDPYNHGELSTKIGSLRIQAESDNRWRVQDFIFELSIEDASNEEIRIFVEDELYKVETVDMKRRIFVPDLRLPTRYKVLHVTVKTEDFSETVEITLIPGFFGKAESKN